MAAGSSVSRLVIRTPVVDDLDALARLVAALNRQQRDPTGHMTSGRLMADLMGPEPWFQGLIATSDNRPVGYAFFHRSYETGHAARGFYVQDLFVVDDMRGRGIGRAIVATIARRARACGASYLWWASKAWNSDAQAIYAHWGGIAEPVLAHAFVGPTFERLADEGQAKVTTP